MKKRILSCLLALLMILPLGACTPIEADPDTPPDNTPSDATPGDSTDFSGTELTLWLEQTFSDSANATMEGLFNDWADEVGATLNIEWISAQDNLKLTTAVEAGAGIPDIMFASAAATRVLPFFPNVPHGDVSDIVSEINAELPYFETVLEGCKFDGVNYYIPVFTSAVIMYVRMDKLEAAGITKVPETWEEVYAAAEAISDPENDFYGLSQGFGPSDSDDQNTIEYQIWSSGGQIFNEKGEVEMDQIARDTIERYIRYFKDGVIPPEGGSWDDGGNNGQYLMGRTGICFNAATLASALKGDDYKELDEVTAMAAMPHGGIENSCVNNHVGLFIMNSCKNKEAAQDLIEYILQEKNYDTILEGLSPVYGPVFERYDQDPTWNDGGVHEAVMGYAKTSMGCYSFPYFGVDAQLGVAKSNNSKLFIGMMASVIDGSAELEQAIEKFAADSAAVQ